MIGKVGVSLAPVLNVQSWLTLTGTLPQFLGGRGQSLKKDKSNKKKANRHKSQSVLIQGLTPLPLLFLFKMAGNRLILHED